MDNIKKLNFHDSILKGLSINTQQRHVIFELDYISDMKVESKNIFTPIYKKAELKLKNYQNMTLDIKGNKNKEIILSLDVEGYNEEGGLLHIKLYTTSDSLINIYCDSYSLAIKE